MPIKLHLVSPDSLPPELSKDIHFDTRDFHIGRGKPPAHPNDWYFPADRNVSKEHATILYKNSEYYLVDRSTNGTYLQHVGKDKQHLRGSEAQLAEGDRIWIGQSEIEVSIETAGETTNTQATMSPPPDPGARSSPSTPIPVQRPPKQQRESITPPSSPIIPASSSIIPDDIDLEWLPIAAENSAGSADSVPSVSESLPDLDFDVAKTAEPEMPVSSSSSSKARVLSDDFEIPPDSNEWVPTQETAEPERPANLTTPVSSSSPPSATTATTAEEVETRPDSNALQAFLAGAGLNSDDLAIDQLDLNLMKTLGTALRRAVEGLTDLLKGRAEFRHVYEAFEDDYTVFGPEQNNPLKHITYVQMALKTMLSQEKGFLPIDQAIEEAIIDIKIHQSALIYGVRNSLKNTLQHFDPEEIKRQTPQRSGLEALLTSKKSQYWDEFVKCYHQQNVNELLRQELVNGYLDYTKRLKKPLNSPYAKPPRN